MKKKKKFIAVRLSKEEYDKLALAKKYTAISSTCCLIRSCINMGIENICIDGQVNMTFFSEQKIDKNIYYTTQVNFDDELNSKLKKIFECVPMASSSIVKYIFMPEIEKIIDNKGWI